MTNIVKRVTINDVPAPTALEIFDKVKDHIAPADHARFKRELRERTQRDAATAKIRADLGPAAVAAIETGLARGMDGARTPKRPSSRDLFHARSRSGGADPGPQPGAQRGRAAFLNSGRFGGHASAEDQRAAAARERAAIIGADSVPEALSTEATLQQLTTSPPGYRRGQVGPQPSLPFSSAPPAAPSAQQAVERGSSGPPYAPVLRGRELMMFRQRHGRDPLPGETMDFGTVPPAAGGAR